MSNPQKRIVRLSGLAKLVTGSERRLRRLAKEWRDLAERVREKERALAAAGLRCHVSHVRRKPATRGMDQRRVGRARYRMRGACSFLDGRA